MEVKDVCIMHQAVFIHSSILLRDWKIRLFFSGDYEFLPAVYGLSGASGKGSFLLCHDTITVCIATGRHNCLVPS